MAFTRLAVAAGWPHFLRKATRLAATKGRWVLNSLRRASRWRRIGVGCLGIFTGFGSVADSRCSRTSP